MDKWKWYESKPVMIQAIQWTGENFDQIEKAAAISQDCTLALIRW